jgi:hypothetical protein
LRYVSSIKFDNNGDRTSDLRCPNCNGTNLHHKSVTIFDRPEDAEFVAKTTVGVKTTIEKLPNQSSGNPSSRREGIVIGFWCETCPAGKSGALELTIAQHKGATEFGWRFEITG